MHENQQIILHVITVGEAAQGTEAVRPASTALPAWCNVYDGLTEEEIAEVETVALDRSNWARSSQ